MNTDRLTLALVFVVAARLLLAQVGKVILYPFGVLGSYLPESSGPSFPRIAKLKERFSTWCLSQLPEWIEYRGNWVFLLKTTYKKDDLEAFAQRIPDKYYNLWHRFGVSSMVALLVSWGLFMLILVGATIGLTLSFVPDVIGYLSTVDVATFMQPNYGQGPPQMDMREIVVGLGALFVSLLSAILAMWIIMLAFLPGLLLHEFGHFASMEHADCGVAHYGILLTGPILGGAFVEPAQELDELPLDDQFNALSAGIANTLIWGSILTVGGLLLISDPVSVLVSVWNHDLSVFASNPVGTVLLTLGVIELSNAQLNALPMGPVDGGRFMQAADDEWSLTERVQSRLPF